MPLTENRYGDGQPLQSDCCSVPEGASGSALSLRPGLQSVSGSVLTGSKVIVRDHYGRESPLLNKYLDHYSGYFDDHTIKRKLKLIEVLGAETGLCSRTVVQFWKVHPGLLCLCAQDFNQFQLTLDGMVIKIT